MRMSRASSRRWVAREWRKVGGASLGEAHPADGLRHGALHHSLEVVDVGVLARVGEPSRLPFARRRGGARAR
jgi:hypothetical protein